MRGKLNENPIAQVALVAILVVVGAVLFISQSGGEEEEGAETSEATVAVAGTGAIGTATGSTPGEAVNAAAESAIASAGEAGAIAGAPTSVPTPPPPRPLTAAYDSGKTVVLLIVHDGGINDKLVKRSAAQLNSLPDVALFTVPAEQIARYAAITVGLNVNRVPALVVMKPKRLSGGTPQATVEYGFQTQQGLAQAVRDAAYHGGEVPYHPN